ncbi:hypothetical protein [Marinicella litoralis]|uniref:Uncharacterized protein n=1 Tax=Marinicella litoralis TaxID=644220 RepID=A0A4R6XXK2_9GAMM|nr:hypothetical protein [Marinicella litoralis]TDR23200.1 hypothetical protein C8D91_0059 [Marinicella litoralis]
MHQFIKNLIAAGILFLSLITSVALCYAITPVNETPKPSKGLEINLSIDKKQLRFNINETLNLLIPMVSK